MSPTSSIPEFRRALLAWYDREQRQLPWRTEPAPYRTLVSELMLQQTQVQTVIPYFERFLARFPNPQALADAQEEEVLKHWQGLGYYRRARYLQAAARQIVADHQGRFPGDKAAIDALPGVGDYTAAAVASIGFGLPYACVDGNVIRVFSRLFAIDGDTATGAVKKDIQTKAQHLLDPERPGDFNQAVMELGATRCSPRQPSCLACPVADHCTVHQKGLDVHTFPFKSKKVKPAKIEYQALFLYAPGRFLLAKRPEKGLMASMWELPAQESGHFIAWPDWFDGKINTQGRLAKPITHRFTHLHATYHVALFRADAVLPWREGVPTGYPEFRWVEEHQLAQLPLTKVLQKALPLIAAAIKNERNLCPNATSTLPGL